MATKGDGLFDWRVMRAAGGCDGYDVRLAGIQRLMPIAPSKGDAHFGRDILHDVRRASDDANDIGACSAKGIGVSLAGKAGSCNENLQVSYLSSDIVGAARP